MQDNADNIVPFSSGDSFAEGGEEGAARGGGDAPEALKDHLLQPELGDQRGVPDRDQGGPGQHQEVPDLRGAEGVG